VTSPQVLTRDFISKFLYLSMTALLSMLAVLMVWLPLNDGYDCIVQRLVSRRHIYTALRYRDWIFLVIAFVLAATAIAQTDICIRLASFLAERYWVRSSPRPQKALNMSDH
jgi:hypothetical protein